MSRRVACAGLVAAALGCNGGLQPTPAAPAISGTVTYQGAVPESTQAVYVVAYHTFPHSRDSLFTFQPPVQSLQPLPTSGATAPYSIPVESGRYEWVVAVWVKQGFTLANADSTLRETGYYRNPADTSQPGVVNVLTQPAESIDFVIDFAHMHPPCRYYTPPCP
jgi:hypothetical protein